MADHQEEQACEDIPIWDEQHLMEQLLKTRKTDTLEDLQQDCEKQTQSSNNNDSNMYRRIKNSMQVVPTHDMAPQHEIADIPIYDNDIQKIPVVRERWWEKM